MWWADCPALLKGWFHRVWTVGHAYKPTTMRIARKALVLCTAGYTIPDLRESGCYEAMRTSMLTDRIGARALSSEFVVFDGAVDGGAGTVEAAERWAAAKAAHLARAAELAHSL